MALTAWASCKRNVPAAEDEYIVAAYIWPSCHDDSLAHAYLWPEGQGEWEVIRKGDPRFEGHYQPKRPLWGYEMDDDPVVVEKWIRTALEYGVNTFVYDWYWFMDYPYLEGALNDGFLKAPSNEKMHFYIMWANHDVVYNYWNYHLHGDNTDLLFDPDVDRDRFKVIVDRIITQYFHLPNYLKIDGKPVMSVFSIDNLARGLGGYEEAGKAVEYFRSEARKAGYPDIYFMETFGGAPMITDRFREKQAEKIAKVGIDAVSFYNMGGFDVDYEIHCQNGEALRDAWDRTFGIPVYPCVSIGWDDTPRYPEKGIEEVSQQNHTPEVFEQHLRKAKEYADNHPEQPKIVTVNAWNEWVEGSYLMPDEVFGFGFLEAVRNVFGSSVKAEKNRRQDK